MTENAKTYRTKTGRVLTDADVAEIRYVYQHTTVTTWTQDFINAFAYLLDEHHAKQDTPLLACYPRDLVRQVRDLARYEETAARIDRRAIDWAWNNYFAGAGARRVAIDQQKKERDRREHPAAS